MLLPIAGNPRVAFREVFASATFTDPTQALASGQPKFATLPDA